MKIGGQTFFFHFCQYATHFWGCIFLYVLLGADSLNYSDIFISIHSDIFSFSISHFFFKPWQLIFEPQITSWKHVWPNILTFNLYLIKLLKINSLFIPQMTQYRTNHNETVDNWNYLYNKVKKKKLQIKLNWKRYIRMKCFVDNMYKLKPIHSKISHFNSIKSIYKQNCKHQCDWNLNERRKKMKIKRY